MRVSFYFLLLIWSLIKEVSHAYVSWTRTGSIATTQKLSFRTSDTLKRSEQKIYLHSSYLDSLGRKDEGNTRSDEADKISTPSEAPTSAFLQSPSSLYNPSFSANPPSSGTWDINRNKNVGSSTGMSSYSTGRNGYNSGSTSMSAYMNSRTVPSKPVSWNPQQRSPLMKEPWKPSVDEETSQLKSTWNPILKWEPANTKHVFGASSSYLNSINAQPQRTSHGTSQLQAVEITPTDNFRNPSSLSNASTNPFVPSPAPQVQVEPWKPPETWTTTSQSWSNKGMARADPPKMKNPWQPMSKTESKSTANNVGFGATSSYFSQMSRTVPLNGMTRSSYAGESPHLQDVSKWSTESSQQPEKTSFQYGMSSDAYRQYDSMMVSQIQEPTQAPKFPPDQWNAHESRRATDSGVSGLPKTSNSMSFKNSAADTPKVKKSWQPMSKSAKIKPKGHKSFGAASSYLDAIGHSDVVHKEGNLEKRDVSPATPYFASNQVVYSTNDVRATTRSVNNMDVSSFSASNTFSIDHVIPMIPTDTENYASQQSNQIDSPPTDYMKSLSTPAAAGRKAPWSPPKSTSKSMDDAPKAFSTNSYLESMSGKGSKDDSVSHNDGLKSTTQYSEWGLTMPNPIPIPTNPAEISGSIETREVTESSLSNPYGLNQVAPSIPTDTDSNTSMKTYRIETSTTDYFKSMSTPATVGRKAPWSPPKSKSKTVGKVPRAFSTNSYLDSMTPKGSIDKTIANGDVLDSKTPSMDSNLEPPNTEPSADSIIVPPSEPTMSSPASSAQRFVDAIRSISSTGLPLKSDISSIESLYPTPQSSESSPKPPQPSPDSAQKFVDAIRKISSTDQPSKPKDTSLTDAVPPAVTPQPTTVPSSPSSAQRFVDAIRAISSKSSSQQQESVDQSDTPKENVKLNETMSALSDPNLSPSPNTIDRDFGFGFATFLDTITPEPFDKPYIPTSKTSETEQTIKGSSLDSVTDNDIPNITGPSSLMDDLMKPLDDESEPLKSSETIIPPFARTTEYLSKLRQDSVPPVEKKNEGSVEDLLSSNSDGSLMEPPSLTDLKIFSFEEQPIEIIEEFVGITKASISSTDSEKSISEPIYYDDFGSEVFGLDSFAFDLVSDDMTLPLDSELLDSEILRELDLIEEATPMKSDIESDIDIRNTGIEFFDIGTKQKVDSEDEGVIPDEIEAVSDDSTNKIQTEYQSPESISTLFDTPAQANNNLDQNEPHQQELMANETDTNDITSDVAFERHLPISSSDIIIEETPSSFNSMDHAPLEPKPVEPKIEILPALKGFFDNDLVFDEAEERELEYLTRVVSLVESAGGEQGENSAFPHPTYGAMLVSKDGEILGSGVSDYNTDAVVAALQDSGFTIEPVSEWVISFPESSSMQSKLTEATLYLTLEPSTERRGTTRPSIVQLIQQAKVSRVVIGAPHPSPERVGKGAVALRDSGVAVCVASELRQTCNDLIQEYANLANSKLRRIARRHFLRYGRPLGVLHCSVIDSDSVEAFARSGNSFGTNVGGKKLSYRNFGTYELAPPPDTIWADEDIEDLEGADDKFLHEVDFEEEDFQGDINSTGPVMPWYSQCHAVVATFPRSGNGPKYDDSITARLNGLKWLAMQGDKLPRGVERILVLDATDLKDIPLTNDNPNLPIGVDVEKLWAGQGRKPTRIILRRSGDEAAKVAAINAAASAAAFSRALDEAAIAIESGDATAAKDALAAIKHQKAELAKAELIQKEIQDYQNLKQKFQQKGVVVESIETGEPIDIMKHIGERNGYHSVVWRAGCWGDRGVKAVLGGAFQMASAHLAVDAIGGKFWQLMLAENAVQAACGPTSKVKVVSDEESLSLEYCDLLDSEGDCVHMINGRPVRHVRLDCHLQVVDHLELIKTTTTTTKVSEKKNESVTEAPWSINF